MNDGTEFCISSIHFPLAPLHARSKRGKQGKTRPMVYLPISPRAENTSCHRMIAGAAPGRITNKNLIEFSTWQSLILGTMPLDFSCCYSFHTTLAAMPRSKCCQSSRQCYATVVDEAGPFDMPCSPRKTVLDLVLIRSTRATVAASKVAAAPTKVLAWTRPPASHQSVQSQARR
jgi:hypothetical protein